MSNGYPVFAMTGSSAAVLVVGYDANNVVLYDPAMGQTYKRTTADADEMFFNAGNIFFTINDLAATKLVTYYIVVLRNKLIKPKYRK